ncbi:uncharacterized protein B0H64DRAFT_383506 [Chaetomium fimeti]|uniref:CCHC-type domain-containing protein n=1 Tax=Chaetomium fimeti TaxID=1854472 RepID=A0AAE0HRN4_9PEZI|nr:hypothetical protein B0H64DRAFT_383506 [Chaetomium fimeti]
MYNTTRPLEKVDEPSPQLMPGKKRPAFESNTDGCGDGVGNRKERVEDAGRPSSKRLKAVGSLNEAEMPDSTASSGPEPSITNLATGQAPPATHGGWNRVISSGLRTSFAGKDNLRKPPFQETSRSPAQPPAESMDVDSLAMPVADANLSRLSGRGVWQTVFARWCVRLMALNKDREDLRDNPAHFREAWGLWLETRTSLTQASRIAAVQAAKEADLDAEKLRGMSLEALETDIERPWNDSLTDLGQSESAVPEQQNNGQPTDTASTSHGSQEANDWAIPPPPLCSNFEVGPKNQRGWEERFVAWCKSLLQLNERKIKVDTNQERTRLTESYWKWVGTIEGLTKAKAAAARRAAVNYAQDNSALVAAIFASIPPGGKLQTTDTISPPPKESAPSPAAAISNELDANPCDESSGPQHIEDAEYREKYFPGVGLNSTFCHACASRDHGTSDCPETTCRFCRAVEHRSFSCPTRFRCTKCRQLGHPKKDCTEKLALPLEDVECAFCQSRDHVDASCHELWRSFSFNPSTVRKVRSLPAFCYCCGRQGHYGPACALNPQKTKEGAWETWSQANCDRYQDPTSSEVAIVFEASVGSASSSERPDLGKSMVPKRHIFFEEADDDDEAEEFIRPPVQKSVRVGHISFAGNGGDHSGRQPNKQYNDRNGRTGFTQPPLPPGPPPPLPPQGSHQQNRRGGRRRRGGGGRHS